jgi:hypothetical protein
VATGKLPPSTVVRLPGGPLQARSDLTLVEWALLCRVDGQRPLTALANRSGRGHGEAVAVAEHLIAAGVLELAGDSDEAGSPRRAAPSTEPDGQATAAAAQAEPAGAEPGIDADGEPVAEGELVGASPPDGAAPGDQPAGGGEEDGGAPPPGQARIDPVSLLRELAASGAEAPAAPGEPEGGDDQDLAALVGRLAGGREVALAGAEAAEDRQAGDEPPRGQGRGADQAEFLREFASLAMEGAAPDDPEPASQPDEDSLDDDRGRGRFGFRRGQRR